MGRKYFGTDGIRAKANIFPMTAEFALKLGLAIAKIIKRNTNRKTSVVIGKDTRLSCYMIESALAAGLTAGGINEVFLVGPIPTPGIAMLVRSMRCNLGIMISASHNPYYDNGIKLFDSNGIKFPDHIEEEIENIIDNDLYRDLPCDDKLGHAWRSDNYIYQQRYIEYVKSSFPKKLDLQGLKIVVDCANGAGYKVAPTVFWELGANIMRIGCQPNGLNINENYGSTKPQNLQKTVLDEKADIGVALDGDADRVIIVDEKGEIVDGDKIIAMIAKKMLNEGRLKKNTVVVTQMSNLGLELYLRDLGINTIRTNVGDRYVAEEMRKNGYNLGGEQSGHIILGDYSTTGDGICCALQVMAMLQIEKQNNKKIGLSQISGLYKTVPQRLENIKFDKNQQNPLDNEELKKFIKKCSDELQGIGRILVRKSGTEPLIRVMVECTNKDKMDEITVAITKKIMNVK